MKAKSISKADTKQDPEKAPEVSSEPEKEQEISMEQVEMAIGMEVNETKEQDLDPPRGIGLKFDEIEKMIDEVLSSGI